MEQILTEENPLTVWHFLINKVCPQHNKNGSARYKALILVSIMIYIYNHRNSLIQASSLSSKPKEILIFFVTQIQPPWIVEIQGEYAKDGLTLMFRNLQMQL